MPTAMANTNAPALCGENRPMSLATPLSQVRKIRIRMATAAHPGNHQRLLRRRPWLRPPLVGLSVAFGETRRNIALAGSCPALDSAIDHGRQGQKRRQSSQNLQDGNCGKAWRLDYCEEDVREYGRAKPNDQGVCRFVTLHVVPPSQVGLDGVGWPVVRGDTKCQRGGHTNQLAGSRAKRSTARATL